jgi:S-methylmethionine-dependent homocysteine/selenocysteine methylase
MAQGLLKQGVDLILCETFAHVGEGLVALEEALQTGLECWLSLCAGPRGQLMRPEALEEAAFAAAERGASAILFNCTAASMSAPYVQAMARSGLRFGVYANAGPSEEALGWGEQDGLGPERYCAHAEAWLEAGASIIGSCCGTRPAHTARLRTLIDERT